MARLMNSAEKKEGEAKEIAGAKSVTVPENGELSETGVTRTKARESPKKCLSFRTRGSCSASGGFRTTFRSTKITINSSNVAALTSKFNAVIVQNDTKGRLLTKKFQHPQRKPIKNLKSPVKAAIEIFENKQEKTMAKKCEKPKIVLVKKNSSVRKSVQKPSSQKNVNGNNAKVFRAEVCRVVSNPKKPNLTRKSSSKRTKNNEQSVVSIVVKKKSEPILETPNLNEPELSEDIIRNAKNRLRRTLIIDKQSEADIKQSEPTDNSNKSSRSNITVPKKSATKSHQMPNSDESGVNKENLIKYKTLNLSCKPDLKPKPNLGKISKEDCVNSVNTKNDSNREKLSEKCIFNESKKLSIANEGLINNKNVLRIHLNGVTDPGGDLETSKRVPIIDKKLKSFTPNNSFLWRQSLISKNEERIQEENHLPNENSVFESHQISASKERTNQGSVNSNEPTKSEVNKTNSTFLQLNNRLLSNRSSLYSSKLSVLSVDSCQVAVEELRQNIPNAPSSYSKPFNSSCDIDYEEINTKCHNSSTLPSSLRPALNKNFDTQETQIKTVPNHSSLYSSNWMINEKNNINSKLDSELTSNSGTIIKDKKNSSAFELSKSSCLNNSKDSGIDFTENNKHPMLQTEYDEPLGFKLADKFDLLEEIMKEVNLSDPKLLESGNPTERIMTRSGPIITETNESSLYEEINVGNDENTYEEAIDLNTENEIYESGSIKTRITLKINGTDYCDETPIDELSILELTRKKDSLSGDKFYDVDDRLNMDDHYTIISDYDSNIYDVISNVKTQSDDVSNCYESIQEGTLTKTSSQTSDSDNSWEHPNSLYALQPLSLLSTSSLSINSGAGSRAAKSETSDEWVDMEHLDDQLEILVYQERCHRKSSHSTNDSWSVRMRRLRTRKELLQDLSAVGISSSSSIYLSEPDKGVCSWEENQQHLASTEPENYNLVLARVVQNCDRKYEAQELAIFCENEGENDTSSDQNIYVNNGTIDEDYTDYDSFDSDSSFENENKISLPAKLPEIPQPSQNIYGLVKQAGKRMRKHWSLSSLGLNIRKINIGTVPPLKNNTTASADLSSSNGASLRRRRWSSFKYKFRSPSYSTSTFYLSNDNVDSSSEAPPLPEKNHLVSRKSVGAFPLDKSVPDVRRLSTARPSSPPPPPPPARPAKSINSEMNKSVANKSDSNNLSWSSEVNLFDSSQKPFSIFPDSAQIYNNLYSESRLWDSSSPSSAHDSMSDQGSSPGSDLHLRFADEPLYQFYTADIAELARHGFDDDFDGYEEIGSLRPTALELVQHRSLWCELPEVKDSGIVGSLEPAKRKLQEAKFEVITSEASYFKSLTVLDKHFVQSPLLNDESILSKNDRRIIFGNVSTVRRCSEKLLASLESCWQESIMLHGICDAVLLHASKNFSIFVKYCSNQVYLDRTLKNLKEKNSRFNDALNLLENDPVCQSLSLHSFLMLPMQRITRLPLLIDAILSRIQSDDEEYHTCQLTLATLNKIVEECNEGARKFERYEEMLRLSGQLDFSRKDVKALPVVSSSRWLVRSGHMMHINVESRTTFSRKLNRPTKLHLFLFTDLLVITKKKSDDHYSVIDYCARNLVQMTEMKDSGVPSSKFSIMLTMLENHEGKTVEMILGCDSESSRQRWLEALSDPRSSNPEETLYEQWDCPQVVAKHDYNASQPDELSLQAGDIVNVSRKMADGWYHGERIRDGVKGWFPANHTNEIISAHSRARNLKMRYRLLALSGSYLQSLQRKKV